MLVIKITKNTILIIIILTIVHPHRMACVTGLFHTITLSDDGVVHSFGRNAEGQLGLGQTNVYLLPTPISNIPQIKQVSCGGNFTVCVDIQGFIWSFGKNDYGQLGTGNKTNFNVPQKILNIPPVLSVACGFAHTLIITNDDNLWSCGSNDYGQLCLGNTACKSKFQQTKLSNITKVSVGGYHSLFQNIKEEIYACGRNDNRQLGLGLDAGFQLKPTLIPNLPSNIIQFVCGYAQNLFLDSEGNVYSVGANYYGQLGLANNRGQDLPKQIQNIPPIQIISCCSFSSYLVDIEGNVWSFGNNSNAQLGHGDKTNKNVPTKIENLRDIQQLSYGAFGNHFFAKDSENKIFGSGSRNFGQLGVDDPLKSISKPEELNSKYFTIWGRGVLTSKAKSARK